MIPNLITGDQKSEKVSSELKNKLLKLNVEPVFIEFMEQYQGQNVYNEICFKGDDLTIGYFYHVNQMLKEREERMGVHPYFSQELTFAYHGGSPYWEFVYIISGAQKGKVFLIITNHIELKREANTYTIDGDIVKCYANSFKEFVSHLSMGEVEVIDRKIKQQEIYLTHIGTDKIQVMHFLKKEKQLNTIEEVRELLNNLPISLGKYRLENIKAELISLGCKYSIKETTTEI